MKQVKNHFEKEAEIFDSIIRTIIPYYEDMIHSLVLALPFHENEMIKVLDLGCGTGNISMILKENFPKAFITCVDLADNMIKMARLKLSLYNDVEFLAANFRDLDFNEKPAINDTRI